MMVAETAIRRVTLELVYLISKCMLRCRTVLHTRENLRLYMHTYIL